MAFFIDGPEAKIIRTGDTSVELRIFAGEVYYNLEPRRLFPLSGLTKYITLLDRENKERQLSGIFPHWIRIPVRRWRGVLTNTI